MSRRLDAAERRIGGDGQRSFALFDHDGAPLNDAARRLPGCGQAFTIRIDRTESGDADASGW